MKLLSFILLLSLPLYSFSQSYPTFHKERPAYYNFSYNDKIFYQQAGISIDSFQVNGSDTIFFHYPIIDNDNSNGCYLKAHDTSFVGFQSIRTSNGDDEFFNRNGDTIYFKNDAALSESWTLHQLSGGNKIIATVQSNGVESVLGVDDSVKIISLQAVDDLGNSIANIFNNKIFKIGKSFGLVSGYSLFHFPIDAIGFSIVGIENPSYGLNTSELSPEKIFDFEIGDRFDYNGGAVTEPTYHYYTCATKTIIAKELFGGGDSVKYTIDLKTHWSGNNWNDYFEGSSDIQTTETYILSQMEFMNARPFQWSAFISDFEGGASWLISSSISLGATVRNFYHNYFNNNDTCLTEIIWGVGPGNIEYASGLGKTYSYYGQSDWNNFETLVYFKKSNGEEWGDSISCIPLGIDQSNQELRLDLFPNPVHDQIFLSGNFIPGQAHFALLNSFGEEMKLNMSSRNTGSVSFDVRDLPPGFYVLQVREEDQVQNLKFVKN